MRTWLALVVAAALGGAARYGFEGVVSDRLGGQFPWGTFAVNATGCLVAGFLYTAMTQRATVDPALRTAVMVGFMGSYTTFSTWMLETMQLVNGGSYLLAATNLFAGVGSGIIAAAAGMALGRFA